MGKLIRKKTAAAKKKKKQDNVKQNKAETTDAGSLMTDDQAGGGTKTPAAKRASQVGSLPAKKKSKPKIKIAFLETSIQFLREVKVELKKVAWPTRKQTLGSTAVVLVIVFMIAFFLGIVDIGLANLIKIVL